MYRDDLHSALTGEALTDAAALAALLESLQERHLPALTDDAASRGRVFLAQQGQAASLLRERQLGKPLWEWRDECERALRALVAFESGQGAWPTSPADVLALAETLEPCGPRTGVETLASAGMSSWYWVGAGGLELRAGPLEVAEPQFDAWRQAQGRPAAAPTAQEILDYASDVYCADTWCDLAWRRPSLITAVTGLAADEALARLVHTDFHRRQLPGVARLIWEEIAGRPLGE